jgi:hypothetical protein
MAGHIVFERSEKISDFSPARERTKKKQKEDHHTTNAHK